jgi:hypothetical protein
LIQKIHCQLIPWVIAPPTTGPPSTARPVIPLNRPIAHARRSGGNASVRIAIESGITSAAPAPCTARIAIRKPTLGASAQAADAAQNRARPAASSRRRPKRSPSAAPVIINTAKLSVYAFTVHSSC